MRIPYISLIAASSIALGGCAYGGLGLGYGNGYGSYGSYGSYYDPYDPYYGGFGSRYSAGYGYPGYGWYNGYYYPGTGYYVYDQYRRPRVWNRQERSFWEEVLRQARRQSGVTTVTTQSAPNWSGFTTRQRTVRSSTISPDRTTRAERLRELRKQRVERRERREATTERRRRASDD